MIITTQDVCAAIFGLGLILDLVLSHKQTAMYRRFRRWREWLASLRLAEVIHRSYQRISETVDALFGKRIKSLRSIVLGASFAAVVAMVFNFTLLGLNAPNGMALVFTYGLVAAVTSVPATFSFVVTRVLIRLLARNVTLGRTVAVLSLELVTIKAIVLAFMAILAMGALAVMIVAFHYQVQPKDAATLVAGFIMLVLGLDKAVILPGTLAFTVLHVSGGVVFLILHFLAKASLLVELLLQGVIRTKRAAFATSGAVIAAMVEIGHVAAVYLQPVIWFESFWTWQAGIDLVVVRNTTAVCSWLLKRWLEAGGGI